VRDPGETVDKGMACPHCGQFSQGSIPDKQPLIERLAQRPGHWVFDSGPGPADTDRVTVYRVLDESAVLAHLPLARGHLRVIEVVNEQLGGMVMRGNAQSGDFPRVFFVPFVYRFASRFASSQNCVFALVFKPFCDVAGGFLTSLGRPGTADIPIPHSHQHDTRILTRGPPLAGPLGVWVWTVSPAPGRSRFTGVRSSGYSCCARA
jgi:hypothetical protein